MGRSGACTLKSVTILVIDADDGLVGVPVALTNFRSDIARKTGNELMSCLESFARMSELVCTHRGALKSVSGWGPFMRLVVEPHLSEVVLAMVFHRFMRQRQASTNSGGSTSVRPVSKVAKIPATPAQDQAPMVRRQ